MNERKYQIAIDALKQIANPIGHLKANLKEGEVLNGQQAILLSENPNYLKGIAEQALDKLGE